MIKARKTANGSARYDVRLRDQAGKVYGRTFRTKREAQTFEARELADRSRGAWIDPRNSATTFADEATRWLSANPGKRPSAWARDESIIRLHLVPVLGPRPIGTITPHDVQALVVAWSNHQAPRTVHREYGVLRAVLIAAVGADLIARSPCRGIKLPRAEHDDRHIVTADELAALADAVGAQYGPMVYLGAVLGLRWGECAGLRVGRLDFLRSTLTVAEQLTRGRGGAPDEGPPKSSAGRRTMAVPAPLMAMLAAHLTGRGLTGADAKARLFPAPAGGPLDYATFGAECGCEQWVPQASAA